MTVKYKTDNFVFKDPICPNKSSDNHMVFKIVSIYQSNLMCF